MATELYPIRKKHLDLQSYLLIKTIMMIRSVKAYKDYAPEFPGEDQLDIKGLSDKLKNDCAFLIFPSLHRQFRLFPQDITQHTSIIAVYDKDINASYTHGKENYYTLKSYYTLECQGDNNGMNFELKSHRIDYPEKELPIFYDNTRELTCVLDRLLMLMEESHLEDDGWYKRLKDCRQMIIKREDGLHILHNIGFYDHDTLRHILSASVENEEELSEVMLEYTNNIAIFAMAVVNGVYKKTGNNVKAEKPKVVRPITPPKTYTQPSPQFRQAPQDVFDDDTELPSPPPPPEKKHVHWKYRHEIEERIKKNSIETQSLQESSAETKIPSGSSPDSRKEKNRKIRMRVFLFAAVMLVLAGIIITIKISLTGAATISVGVISAIIIRGITRLKEGYDDSDSQPRWFVTTLVISSLIGTLAGIVVCKKLSEVIYTATNAFITPWTLFAFVATVMVGVFICCWLLKLGKTGKASRPYIVLMVVAVCLTISQFVGSLTYSSQISGSDTLNSLEKLSKQEKRNYEKRITGVWVTNADILGKTKVTEEFKADGTWHRGNEDGIQSIGKWTYIGNSQMKVQETWTSLGDTHSPSDNEWILTITSLTDDKMCCNRGEYPIVYQRMKENE